MNGLLLRPLHGKGNTAWAKSSYFLDFDPRHFLREGFHYQGIPVGELVYPSLIECFQLLLGLAKVFQNFVHERTIPGVAERHYMGYSNYMTKTKNIKAGTTFRILVGMPRTGTVTRVTAAKVYYDSINEAGMTQHFITPRSMFLNPVMIEVNA